MLVAYLDEVAEAGAFVSKTHKNYNGSPAFGYAGFEDAWVIGHYVLLEGQLFGFLVPESRYFSWLGPTMRMDRSCCWKGDFSAL